MVTLKRQGIREGARFKKYVVFPLCRINDSYTQSYVVMKQQVSTRVSRKQADVLPVDTTDIRDIACLPRYAAIMNQKSGFGNYNTRSNTQARLCHLLQALAHLPRQNHRLDNEVSRVDHRHHPRRSPLPQRPHRRLHPHRIHCRLRNQ